MLANFLALMLLFLQSFINPLFLMPLGFISCMLVFQLFRKMGG